MIDLATNQIVTSFIMREYHVIFITESLSGQTQLSDDLVDPEDNPQKFISLLLESLFVLRKIPETAEVGTISYSYTSLIFSRLF